MTRRVVRVITTGVYMLRCKKNGKVYVGGAYRDFCRRFRAHRNSLIANTHHNKHLQNAWNKYGPSAFAFRILERHPLDGLVDRETEWIKRLKAADNQFGFNKHPTGGSPLGTKYPPEFGEKVSRRNRERNKDPKLRLKILGAIAKAREYVTDDSRKKIGAANIGRIVSSETRRKISAANKGRKRSGLALENIRKAIRNRVMTPALRYKCGNGCRGKKRSLSVIEKTAAKLRGRKWPRDLVELIRSKNSGKKRSKESRRNISVAQKRRFEDPEQRRKSGLKNVGRILTEEHRKRISEGQMRPETVKRKSEAAKLQWKKIKLKKAMANCCGPVQSPIYLMEE